MEELKSLVTQNNLVITVFLALLISSIFLIVSRSRSGLSKSSIVTEDNLNTKNNLPTFIIIGAADSGKTSFFQYLSYLSTAKTEDPDAPLMKLQDLDIATTKSFKLNFDKIKLPFQSSYKTQFLLIDIPGEEKVFNAKIKEIVNNFTNIKGAIFMIDASVNNNKINSIGKQIFRFLMLSETRPNGIDTLLAINKTDQFGARPVSKFGELLEQEINDIKNLNLQNLKSVKQSADNDDQDEQDEILEEFGNTNVKFRFQNLEGNFDVYGGSLLKGSVDTWINWIDERASN
ncbi:Signal recognition particle receptor subunit beta [Saccharomycopsis crataegensis]|uniref:Signal recognition particle receptor subunit beta n=1 Tax=Saccharomycopsis crataegensis TaxID=43959 RepID=A0AAV5QMF8_9ASCO|nr:Signal recognition particle receptor subunit beta [Saccharomycopsis crataegensis]